jgi:hypothetical protein
MHGELFPVDLPTANRRDILEPVQGQIESQEPLQVPQHEADELPRRGIGKDGEHNLVAASRSQAKSVDTFRPTILAIRRGLAE